MKYPSEQLAISSAARPLYPLGIRHIAFNPVAPTNLVRALAAVAKEESASGVREFRVPDKESLTALAESSSGDIRYSGNPWFYEIGIYFSNHFINLLGIFLLFTFRAAVNALQFACLKSDIGSCFDTVTSLASSTSSKGKKKKVRCLEFQSKFVDFDF